MSLFDQATEAAAFIRAHVPAAPDVAVVLGSGLGTFADGLEAPIKLPYESLPHWPASRVVGHAGTLVVGSASGHVVAALSGRAHLYEGHTLDRVTFPTRVMGLLGVRTLVLTNAAGGINPTFSPGTLMVIDDHINLMGASPLVGPNDERFGPRFPDMTEVYAAALRALADASAAASGVRVRHGVYVGLHGPSYETPAEIRFLRGIGADAVGMSTVPEAIVARHMGLAVLGISCITNPAAGVLPAPLDHDEVMKVARRVSGEVVRLLEAILGRL
jgi:purine-nucleoside phosphorylase